MDLEKRKQENQKERLRQNERAKRLKEQETAIKLDKRLSDAEKIRKIKLLQDGECWLAKQSCSFLSLYSL